MRIFLQTILIYIPVFVSPLINLVHTIITNNNHDNHKDLLIMIHEMCNSHKVLHQVNYSEKTILHNTFYIVNTNSGGSGLQRFYTKYHL
jgi:hypothetical protein